jgi:hypothetical protein
MKTFARRTALTSIALLLILGGANGAFANEQNQNNQNNHTQTLSTMTTGGVSNLGYQRYTVSGGQVAFAEIAGQTVNPTTATIEYNLRVTQNGLTTTGHATLSFTGMTTGGARVSVNGTFAVGSIVPAAELPYGCSTNCQSALPFFFVGTSPNVQVTVAGSTQTVPETMQIESPYFNPWGAPIVLASMDNSIVIAATYTRGNIDWTGTKLGGVMAGTLGTTQASGMLNMTSTESENLVTGIARDSGTISFSSMTPSSLNGRGSYTGTSTIPQTNTSDCSAWSGIPGTCTQTGFQSAGSFTMGRMAGNYSSTWGVPALGFYSSVSATTNQNNQNDR